MEFKILIKRLLLDLIPIMMRAGQIIRYFPVLKTN